MKNTVIISVFSILMQVDYAQNSPQNSDGQVLKNTFTDEISVLDYYRQYSLFTDPGKYEYVYRNLPYSLPELCNLIRSQFIHPFAELPEYRELIPQGRWNEMVNYPSVKSILEGLLSYNSAGLVLDRKPEDRLVLGCQQNAILLASILKYRGIPARVRAGHATYIAPGFHISHAICEVWNEDEMRWMLVDPSMNMVDFSTELFDFSNELWIKFQNGEIDPNLYGIPHRYTGLVSITGKVCTDLASILGTEYPIDQYAPILDDIFKNNLLSPKQIETLNKICDLMMLIDAENISKLKVIYNNNPEIQITKSFGQISTNSDNSTRFENN